MFKQMKKYDQVISIEIEVNAIAQMLFNSLNPEFKHKDNVVDAIISPALANGSIGFIYNALSGFTPEIDFKVDDLVVCTDEVYYTAAGEASRKDHPIGNCKVIEIDLYSKEKLKVEYQYNIDKNDKVETVTNTKWVNHKTCSKIQVVEAPIGA
jgi:hypothetical protein